ncbi:MAG: F0F1 ATP synthase subunit A [Oscillospiraceae bacterium]|nr:F0F1 ATP synthase subunit A [Oscillospiraceae bacterium]
MDKKTRNKIIVVTVIVLAVLLVGIVLTGSSGGEEEELSVVMRDGVLHEVNRVSLFGMDVNPSVISGFLVTLVLLVISALLRIFVIPKFKLVLGRLQMLLEMAVNLFNGLAKTNSPHRNGFLGVYVFAAGTYIFCGTIFELLGVQVFTTDGNAISLPAASADINAAIALGVLSYLVILSGGIAGNGVKGIGLTLKEFSLPISMTFRLFGALLSGLLVTELVYYSITLSFVLPVIVAIMFTLLHALIQAYVLTMLTATYYGEVSEPHPKKQKVRKGAQTASPENA